MSPMCTSTTLPRLKPARAALYAVLCLAITPLGTPAEARAPFDCSVSQAAGKPAPPKPRPHDANSFRILWHVATQIEDLADAASDPKAMADVREAQKLVDGYYFNALMAGSLIYWPGRPKTCQVNFKRVDAGSTMDIGGEDVTFSQGGAAARDACKKQQDAFLAKQPPDTDTPGEIQARWR